MTSDLVQDYNFDVSPSARRLTAAEREQFDRDGYLFLPECFSQEEAALLRREADVVYAMDRKEVVRESSWGGRKRRIWRS